MKGGFLVAGRGRLGISLHGALLAAGLHSELLPGRGDLGALSHRLGVLTDAHLVLAVPDPVIQAVASGLAASGLSSNVAVIHLSGSLGLGSLAAVQAVGCAVGAFHPLQSFPKPRPPSAFRGSTFGIDASSEVLLGELEAIAAALGGSARRVRDDQRAMYHLAGVIASNYLTCLADQAAIALMTAGWSRAEALNGLVPLMTGAVDNLASLGLPGAIIGPIRRGDLGTVRRHLSAIAEANPGGHLDDVYRALGMVAVDLATEAGLDPARAAEIARSLAAADRKTGDASAHSPRLQDDGDPDST